MTISRLETARLKWARKQLAIVERRYEKRQMGIDEKRNKALEVLEATLGKERRALRDEIAGLELK